MEPYACTLNAVSCLTAMQNSTWHVEQNKVEQTDTNSTSLNLSLSLGHPCGQVLGVATFCDTSRGCNGATMGIACCRQDVALVPGDPDDDCPKLSDGPSLASPCADFSPEVEEQSLVEDEEELGLPPGGMFTVLMFGMTGAGKSALGNLMAGCDAFAFGDDTASVTNLDSVMRYEAADDSLVILDTIGLGDTEIDQDKVVASIRDVALSAVNGVDAMCFVMRNARITDDAIARLIYVTEYLWGSECLLNLYVIVTFASKYLASREEANEWIERQVELNWRFKHIYELVGRNPYRFLFVDNPSADSGEPSIEERQTASRRALMNAFIQHPRDVIPPFTHKVMEKARCLVEAQKKEVEKATEKFAQLHAAKVEREKKRRKSTTKRNSKRQITAGTEAVQLALEEKKKAQMSLTEALMKVRSDADFQREVAMEAELATIRFGQDFDVPDSESTKNSTTPGTPGSTPAQNPVQACKRMFFSLVKSVNMVGIRKGSSKMNQISVKEPRRGSKGIKEADAKARPQPKRKASAEDIQKSLDAAIFQLKTSVKGPPHVVFKQLDTRKTGMVTPMEFSQFVQKNVSQISDLAETESEVSSVADHLSARI